MRSLLPWPAGLLLAGTLSVPAESPLLKAAGWLEWRGNHQRNGIWHDTILPDSFSNSAPKILWKKQIGTGYSGPSVWDEKVFLLDRQLPGGDEPEKERVVCLDAVTGNITWVHSYPCNLKLRGSYANGPRTTPTLDTAGGPARIYTLGAMGNLHCLDAASGKVLWAHDLVARFGAIVPWWGVANSPWVEGDLVIVQAGATNSRPATVMAFDKMTGQEKWASGSDKAGYSSMVAIDAGGKRQLIVWTGDALCSFDPKTGSNYWRLPRKLAWDQAVATPMYEPASRILLISSEREGTLALRMKETEPGYDVLWDKMSLSLLQSTAVVVEGYLYGVHHNGVYPKQCGEFRCLDLATGEQKWSDKTVTRLGMFAQSHVTYNAGNRTFYLFNELGELILAKAGPDGYRETGRAQISGKTWSHPAFAGGKIFARSEETVLCATLLPAPHGQPELKK